MRFSKLKLLLLALMVVPLGGCEMSCRSDSDPSIGDVVDDVADEVKDTVDDLKD